MPQFTNLQTVLGPNRVRTRECRQPMLIMDNIFEGFSASLNRRRLDISRWVAYRHYTYRMEVGRDSEKLFHLFYSKYSSESCRQAFVHRCQEDQHASASDVEVPVGSWPLNLRTIFVELVGFSVTVMIDLFAYAGYD